jgi:FixJ family two-component response regulator
MANSWRSRLEGMFPAAWQPPRIDSDTAAEAGRAAPAERVLVVDDDRAWRDECAFTLRALGYDPVATPDPDEALALFAVQPIEIAILDYTMPGRDGVMLSHELNRIAEAQGRRLHVIMATAHATKDVAIDAMRASAVDFLEKPVRSIDLRKALQRIKGLSDAPGAREALLQTMAGLRCELQRLATLIDDSPPRPPAREARVEDGIAPTPTQLAGFIRDLLRKEAKRRDIGGGEVFGDPAWEMLLDLMLAQLEQRTVAVSSACIASGAPMSTALRLVGRLVETGVLHKIPDPRDRRRHFLAINPRFEQPLRQYLVELLRRSTSAGEV